MTAKNVDIDGGDINFSNGTFHVDANGKLTATNVDIDGGDINLGTGVFHVTNAGAVTASSMAITGGSIKIGSKASISDANDGVYIASDGIALGKSNKFKVTNAGALTAKDVDIDGGDLNLGSGVFHVDSNGNLTAKSGYIGNGANGWKIENTYIRSNNGPTSTSDTTHGGMYVGVDGIVNNDINDPTYRTLIGRGLISTAALSSRSHVCSGNITADGNITGAYKTVESGATYTGVTDAISWADYFGNGHAINVKNGIIVGMS